MSGEVRRILLIAAAVLALVALVAAPASAAPKYATKVVVSIKVPAFHGTLVSGKAACKSNRTVKLFRKRNGTVKLLKQGTSNAKGRWSTPVGNLTSGEYFAKAIAKGSCKAGKSKVLTID